MGSVVSNWKIRGVALLAAVTLMYAGLGWTSAHAATGVTPGDGWHFFSFGGVGTFAPQGPFTYSSTTITKITVTDAFCKGDEFRVYDGTTALGDTSVVATDPSCAGTGDPDAALADPTYSHGVFFVMAGSHSINIQATESPFGAGGAYVRVDAVTVTKDSCKDGGWMNYGGLFKNQGDCVSYVSTQGKNEPGQNVPGAP